MTYTTCTVTYHDVLGEEIVAEGAVVEVDLVEGLFGQLNHITLVVAAILVLTDHLLSHSQLVHCCFIALSEETKHNRFQSSIFVVSTDIRPTGQTESTESTSAACSSLKGFTACSATYFDLSGAFVSTAGDMHDEGPLVWLHEYSGGLGTRRVVGGRTAAVGALHTAAGRFLHPLLTVVTLLPGTTQILGLSMNIGMECNRFCLYTTGTGPTTRDSR